jgi:hypothetical protein
LRNDSDQVDPGLAARCEQIAAAWSELLPSAEPCSTIHRPGLSDPEMLGYEPLTVALCYDPAYLQHRVHYFTRREDSYDWVGIREREIDARWNARSIKEAQAPWN